MDDRLVDAILQGQAFAAAFNKMPKLIEERYSYHGDEFKQVHAAENMRTLNVFSGKVNSDIQDHLDLFTDPRFNLNAN